MKKINKKPSLSIYIPAYNEAANIELLLKSLINQKRETYELKNITVVSDGSTDSTENIVRNFRKQNSLVRLFADRKRVGKTERLNQIFKMNKSDLIFLFDGDVLPTRRDTIDQVLVNFNVQRTAIVGCDKVAIYPKTFTGRLIYHWYLFSRELRKDLNQGDNIYNFSTCAFALTGNFAKQIQYSSGISPITKYTYLLAETKGLNVRFAKNSAVYFSLPDNTDDYLRQINRFTKTKELNSNYFGKKTYQSFHKISLSRKIFKMIKVVTKNPLYYTLAIVYRVTLHFLNHKHVVNGNMWDSVKSTKQIAI